MNWQPVVVLVFILIVIHQCKHHGYGTNVTLKETNHNKALVDVVLGGLFPIHTNSKQTDRACGNHISRRYLLLVEAMLSAIDRINNDPTLLPGMSNVDMHYIVYYKSSKYRRNDYMVKFDYIFCRCQT